MNRRFESKSGLRLECVGCFKGWLYSKVGDIDKTVLPSRGNSFAQSLTVGKKAGNEQSQVPHPIFILQVKGSKRPKDVLFEEMKNVFVRPCTFLGGRGSLSHRHSMWPINWEMGKWEKDWRMDFKERTAGRP